MDASINAYAKVCKILGIEPTTVTEQFTEIPNATLVIVPNKVFTHKKLFKLFNEFNKNNPHYINEEFYKKYTKEQLSGEPKTSEDYRYLYIPDNYTDKYLTVKEQVEKYKHDRVPSFLEAMCFWYTLKEASKTLDFDHTYIRHFDLPVIDGDVPCSGVYVDGGVGAFRSAAGGEDESRVAVGSNLDLAPSIDTLSFDLQEVVINNVRYRKVEQ